jgi:hypothetical protein
MVFALASVVPTAACAHGPGGRIEVEIYDRSEGRLLTTYDFAGRRYVVGKPGNEYVIRVRNGTAERTLAVMSVDGVNVISGDTASPRQSGYVLGPGESADIAGWRKDMARTAAFYFTALPDSYAARTGRPDNVGVIGVALFRERMRTPPVALPRKDVSGAAGAIRSEAGENAAAPAAPATAEPLSKSIDAARANSTLGTGHGRVETSYSQYTTFERASDTPYETIAIYYDSYANLLALGVPVASHPLARARPDPFPAHFVPDPR